MYKDNLVFFRDAIKDGKCVGAFYCYYGTDNDNDEGYQKLSWLNFNGVEFDNLTPYSLLPDMYERIVFVSGTGW